MVFTNFFPQIPLIFAERPEDTFQEVLTADDADSHKYDLCVNLRDLREMYYLSSRILKNTGSLSIPSFVKDAY